MRITLNQEEIEEAIEKLILDQVDVPEDMRIDIDLKATRGDAGYTAEIDIVAIDAPDDGTDRSVDDRIAPVEGAETLGIAEKVLEAKQAAVRPRRRGRPAGAKNKPKTHRVDPDLPETSTKKPVTEDPAEAAPEPVQEPAQEAQEEIEQPEVIETAELVGDAPDEAPVAAEQEASIEVQEEAQSEEEVARAADAMDLNAPVEVQAEPEAETEAEAEYAPTPETSGLETDVAEAKDPEPVSEPEPETQEEAPAPPANPAPTRSLFANLQRPVNKPVNG